MSKARNLSDFISSKTLTFAANQISGNSVDGGVISNFASTGIDDNASSTAVTILSDGKVGIGIESPVRTLDVDSSTSSDIARFGNDSGTYTLGYTTDLASIDLASSAGLRVRSGSTLALQTTSDGRVGIGTTSPAQKLHVYSTSGNTYAKLESNGNSTRSALLPSAKKSDGSALNGFIGVVGDANKMEVATTTNDPIHFYTNNNPTNNGIFLKADGNVGIGTDNPAYHIDARGGTSTAFGMRVKTGDNGYDGLIVSNSSALKCYPAAGQSVSLQAYNSSGSAITGVKVTGASTPAGDISTEIESVTELLGHNVYDNGSYGTSNDQYVDLEDWSPTDFRILEIFGTANPNSLGSSAYHDPVHMYVYNGTGWNGAEVTYYVYGKSVAPLARDIFSSGSGSSANVAEVWWYNSSTTAQQDAATSGTASGYHLRLKFPNTNTASTGISLKVIKRA
jgi:hypothetical protein